MKKFVSIGLLLVAGGALSYIGYHRCSVRFRNRIEWHPDTRILDEKVNNHELGEKLKENVVGFYELLRDKKWRETYKRHTLSFRAAVSEDQYVGLLAQYGTEWALLEYAILRAERVDEGAVQIECRVVERPPRQPGLIGAIVRTVTSRVTVCWRWEEGQWRCNVVGSSCLPPFPVMPEPCTSQ